MHRVFSLLLFFALLRPGLAQDGTHTAVIPQRTEVEIELLDNLSSETLRAGQSVSFKVVRPVVVNETTMMAANMPVSGEVKAVQPSGAWRKAGSFDLILKPATLDDGSIVRLDFQRPTLRGTKGEKAGQAIGTGLGLAYYFPLIPAALIWNAKKGKPYNIRSGERYLVYVVSNDRPARSGISEGAPAPEKTTESPKP